MDTNTRTLAKTVTYRLATFVLTYLITMLLTGQQTTSAGIAILSLTVGSLTFIIHERIWTRVKWGNLGGFDRKVRSVIKTITYRLWSLFIVFVLGLFFGLGASEALSVTVVLNIMYLLTHYTNERVWNRVKWGKN
jgi:uncharacterized membrane protein